MEIGRLHFFQDRVLFTSQSGDLYAGACCRRLVGLKYETGDQLQCGPTLAGDKTFLGGCDANLHVIDVNNGHGVGQPLPIDAPAGSTPSVLGDHVFVPTYAGEIFCFKLPSFELHWRFREYTVGR
ncbi:MAG: PQQ-binding-like beta-propeller repeat protein [Pirellulaceae bacterium]